MNSIKNIEEIDINTPFGKPSDLLRIGDLGGMEVVFLARHGRNHTFGPTEVPYRANIWALRSLNVRWIVSPSAVGSLQQKIRPLDIVIPDQFIDRTHQRPLTFFSDGAVAHVSMADPFCEKLTSIFTKGIIKVIDKKRKLHIGGTYLAMEGPAFSTRAESLLYRKWGCSIIGMTNHTEARLAKEAEIAYLSIAMVTDYDCWHKNHKNVTVKMVIENLQRNAAVGEKIVEVAAREIALHRPSSSSHYSLKDGLVTDKCNVPLSTRKKIDLFTKDYWGESQ